MRNSLTHLQQQQTLIPNDVNLCLYYFTNSHNRIYRCSDEMNITFGSCKPSSQTRVKFSGSWSSLSPTLNMQAPTRPATATVCLLPHVHVQITTATCGCRNVRLSDISHSLKNIKTMFSEI